MIAKRSMRGVGQGSSFTKLANYMLDKKQDGHKVAAAWTVNCLAPDMGLALKEIEATQAMNRRSEADKTYHLIISFAAGDHPDLATMKAIEAELAERIGLGDHQRVSVVHNDTDHPHIHIAINKVHPTSFRNVEPYYDFKELEAACVQLEQRYELASVDHRPHWQRGQGRAAANDDLAAHRAEQSFESWLGGQRDGLMNVLERSKDWKALAEGLAKYNVSLRPRGAGFVFSDRDRPLFTKASGIDRGFSKAALEARFGAYPGWKTLDNSNIPAETRYAGVTGSNGLYAAYAAEKQKLAGERRGLLADHSAERSKAYKTIRDRGRAKRAALTATSKSVVDRRAEYSLIKMNTLAELATARETFRKSRSSIMQATKTLSWQDYLMREAENGSAEALAILRRREQRGAKQAAHRIEGAERAESAAFTFSNIRYTVNKWGHVTYQMRDGSTLIDRGQRIDLAKPDGWAGAVALELAMEKYGNRLTLNGSEAFIDGMIAEAAKAGRRIEFTDAEHQQRLEALRDQGDPVKRYLADRNATAGRVKDLLPHTLMREDFAGEAIWRGSRRVDENGQITVGLYEADGVIQVRRLDRTEQDRAKTYRIGQKVKVSPPRRERHQNRGQSR